jgi:transposase
VIQITPQMHVLVAVEPVDFRCGIDGMARLCRERLQADPFSGAVYVFRNRRGTAIKVLVYDSQGFWLCHKRLSVGKFGRWPAAAEVGAQATSLRAHELTVLLAAGNPSATGAAPEWRRVTVDDQRPETPPRF